MKSNIIFTLLLLAVVKVHANFASSHGPSMLSRASKMKAQTEKTKVVASAKAQTLKDTTVSLCPNAMDMMQYMGRAYTTNTTFSCDDGCACSDPMYQSIQAMIVWILYEIYELGCWTENYDYAFFAFLLAAGLKEMTSVILDYALMLVQADDGWLLYDCATTQS